MQKEIRTATNTVPATQASNIGDIQGKRYIVLLKTERRDSNKWRCPDIAVLPFIHGRVCILEATPVCATNNKKPGATKPAVLITCTSGLVRSWIPFIIPTETSPQVLSQYADKQTYCDSLYLVHSPCCPFNTMCSHHLAALMTFRHHSWHAKGDTNCNQHSTCNSYKQYR